MNTNNERRNLMAGVMILAAGGMVGMASAVCPPEESGSPDPAGQRQIEIQLMNGERAQLLGAYRQAMPVDAFTFREPGASTLDTKVYRVGESPLARTYVLGDEPGVVRVVRSKQNGQDVVIEDRNGAVTAKLNGQEVPADRVSQKGNTVEIKDENGKVIFSEELPAVSAGGVGRGGATTPAATWWSSDTQMPALGEKRAFMGITMDEASSDVTEHLGLKGEGPYAMIDEVYEGMPAEKAGLKSKDVIVSIDGKSPASPEAIRDVLKSKKAGETVKLELMRQGTRQEVTVTLGEWKNQGQSVWTKAAPRAVIAGAGDPADAMGGVDWEKFAQEWAKKAEEMAKSGKDMGQWQKEFQEKVQEQLKDGDMKFAVPRGGKDPIMFAVPTTRGRDVEEQLKVMEEQLKRMEEQMRRLEKRLGSAPTTPVAPAPPVAPGGGGGQAPTPSFAWQM